MDGEGEEWACGRCEAVGVMFGGWIGAVGYV